MREDFDRFLQRLQAFWRSFCNSQNRVRLLVAVGLLGMGLILAGTLGMLQRKPRERASSGWGWLPWAVLSAVCASLTSILGKVGMTGVDSYVGTAIRNMVVLAMASATSC